MRRNGQSRTRECARPRAQRGQSSPSALTIVCHHGISHAAAPGDGRTPVANAHDNRRDRNRLTRIFEAAGRIVLMFAVFSMPSCRRMPLAADESSLARFEFNEPQMGVPFRIVLYAPDESTATQAAQDAFARIGELNAIMSDYETDSELNRLTRTSGPGRPVRVSGDLWDVLTRAQTLAERSGGAFDVTVGPYVGLWRKARREQALPKPALLADARSRVGWTNMILHPDTRSVELLAPVMHLDLGGIAKGYAVDEALAILRGHGLHRCLVSGGGDMAVGKPPPGRKGWQVKLDGKTRGETDKGGDTLRLSREAVATSGDLFQFLEIDGVRYSHIVDPRTGLGLTNRSLVTVVAPDCTTADSLATTVSVLGPREGMEFLRRYPQAEGRMQWSGQDGIREAATAGFGKRD